MEATYTNQKFEDEETFPKYANIPDCDDLDGGEKLACHWSLAVRRLDDDDADAWKQDHLNKVSFHPIGA